MKIYLAGKITAHPWRQDIVAGIDVVDPDREWTVLRKSIYREHDYVGPYFTTEDLGHGQWDISERDHAVASGLWSGHYGDQLTIREEIVSNCLKAIENAELVFAWIDQLDAFGTFAEIGFARGKGKKIFIGYQERFKISDLWFLESMVEYDCTRCCDSPSSALVEAIEWASGSSIKEDERLSLCESPIEASFLKEAIQTDELAAIIPQHRVSNYRLDFALPDAKFCVELDGHEAHKTKEQRTHDAARERWLELNGWRVVRFTGSEVFRDAKRCVVEAIKLLKLSRQEA